MFATAVAASIVGTIAYTAWSSRRKIEMAAKLLIEEATLARIVSQDSQTAVFIQQQYVNVCSDALLLVYGVKLSQQRGRLVDEERGVNHRDSAAGEGTSRGAVNKEVLAGGVGSGGDREAGGRASKGEMRDFLRDCEEMALAEGGGGGGGVMAPALQEKVRHLLEAWELQGGGAGASRQQQGGADGQDGQEEGQDGQQEVCEVEQLEEVFNRQFR